VGTAPVYRNRVIAHNMLNQKSLSLTWLDSYFEIACAARYPRVSAMKP